MEAPTTNTNSKVIISPVQTKQKPFVGYIAWLIQRITALILLIVFPLKMYSGYAITGKVPGQAFLSSIHTNSLLDTLLIFAIIFHALYGIRVILIDLGFVKDNRGIFKLFTILGSVIFAVLFFFIIS